MKSIPLTDLPGSKLYHDFVGNTGEAASLFPFTTVSPELIADRANAIDRTVLKTIVDHSMAGITPSADQLNNMQKLSTPSGVAVVTGQQVGLFGGPLYTILKIYSAVQLAASIPNAVPVFWLEDNDHDAEEASTASLTDATGQPFTSTIWDGSSQKVPVGDRIFSKTEIEHFEKIVAHIQGEASAQVKEHALASIQEGRSWSAAFLELIQPYLAHWGVVVVKASEVVRMGVHAALILEDLNDPGKLSAILHETSSRIQSYGYHIQVHPPDMLFFHHTRDGRTKINPDNAAALVAEHPATFSPSALARPLVQDLALPTVATVLGPAELAYYAQLTDLYAHAGVTMPAPFPRHTATIVDARTERNMSKESIEIEQMMKSWQEVERIFVVSMSVDVIPAIDHNGIDALIAPFVEAAAEIDSTLVASAQGIRNGIVASYETLASKLRSALKKKNSLRVDRLRGIHASVYPFDTPQERVYPLAYWEAKLGRETLIAILERIGKSSRTVHNIVFVQRDV